MATIQINADIGVYMRAADPTQVHSGNGNEVHIGETATVSAVERGVIKIPFTGLPAGSTITAATLDLYLLDTTYATSNRLASVYRIKRAMTYDGVSWNNYDTGQAWQTPGASGANDREASASGTRTFNTTDTINQYYSITLTVADIQAMFDGGYTNNGFLLQMATEVDDRYTFTGHAVSNPPRLTITYTPPPSSGSSAFFMNLLS